jgi:tRNA(adenine34) deaminase
MQWEQLEAPWRVCIEEAWTAYRAGSLPIGAAIYDADGELRARGRNRFYESGAPPGLLAGHRLAHAEINALLALDWAVVDSASCVLYTTTEPCPLCVGAVRITRLGAVRFASRDGAAGSAELFGATPFMRRGEVAASGPERPELEAALVALLVEFALGKSDANTPSWCERLGQVVPNGLALGRALSASGELRRWAAQAQSAGLVVDSLVRRLPG